MLGETECFREILSIARREFLAVKIADGRVGLHNDSLLVPVDTSHPSALDGGDQAILKLAHVFSKIPTRCHPCPGRLDTLQTKLSKFATEMGPAALSALGYNNKADFVKKQLYVLRSYP
jgi:hypothetical protein